MKLVFQEKIGGNYMQSEWNRGAAYMRDNVIAHIIGMQNDLGNDIKDKGYQELQRLGIVCK